MTTMRSMNLIFDSNDMEYIKKSGKLSKSKKSKNKKLFKF